jgi:hypothetical protein
LIENWGPVVPFKAETRLKRGSARKVDTAISRPHWRDPNGKYGDSFYPQQKIVKRKRKRRRKWSRLQE